MSAIAADKSVGMAYGIQTRGLRRSRRVACQAKMQLSWVTATGEPCSALTMCTDLSQEGMQVTSPAAIPLRTNVQFLVPGSPLQGSGTVRSCSRNGGKFAVGLTFSVPLKVDPATTPIPGVDVREVFGTPGNLGANVRTGS